MKKLSLLAIVMIVGFSASVMAQSVTANASATATIIAPLTISKTTDMGFGTVSAGNAGGTVVLATDNSRTRTGDAQISSTTTGDPSAAVFTIGGQGAYAYTILIPTVPVVLTSGENTMNVSAFNCVSGAGNTTLIGALTEGADLIKVGATLTVAANQVVGTYSGDFDVTVAYN